MRPLPPARSPARHPHAEWRDRRAFRNPLEACHDDPVAVGEPAPHDPIGSLVLKDFERAHLDRVLCVDDHRLRIAAPVAGHALLRDEKHALGGAGRHLDLHVHAGQQELLGILEGDAQGDNPGLGIHERFCSRQRTGLVIRLAVGEDQGHVALGIAELRKPLAPAPAQKVRGRLGHVDVNAVDIADRGERVRLPDRDERPGRRLRKADLAREPRLDLGALELDFRLTPPRLGQLQRGPGAVARGDRVIQRLLRGNVAALQLQQTVRLLVRGGKLRLGLRDRGPRLGKGRLVACGIDGVEDLTFLHPRPFVEAPLENDAGNLRTDLCLFECGHAPGQDRRQSDGLLGDLDDLDARRRRVSALLLRQSGQAQEQDCPQAQERCEVSHGHTG